MKAIIKISVKGDTAYNNIVKTLKVQDLNSNLNTYSNLFNACNLL